MSSYIKSVLKSTALIFTVLITASCVTETIDSPDSMRIANTSIVSVQDPSNVVSRGNTFAWQPDAVYFYKDDRFANAPIKTLIEEQIIENMLSKGLAQVGSVNTARFTIAYTAALESVLDDNTIIRRFGLLPGHAQVPPGDANLEKGTLIVYLFDNKTNDIVWRSAAQGSVKFNAPTNERKKNIQRILAEMFQTFSVSE